MANNILYSSRDNWFPASHNEGAFDHCEVIFLSTGQLWHYTDTQAIHPLPTPFTNRCCLESFMRSLFELSINQQQSSEQSIIWSPILPSTVSPVHSQMKRSQHCIAPLALCKYYMFSLDMLVGITSTLWLHYF